jgi:hypothetical protein
MSCKSFISWLIRRFNVMLLRNSVWKMLADTGLTEELPDGTIRYTDGRNIQCYGGSIESDVMSSVLWSASLEGD